MKWKMILSHGVVLVTAYGIGKIVGGLKVCNFMADEFEKEFPGFKKGVTKAASDKVIDRMFNKTEEHEGV